MINKSDSTSRSSNCKKTSVSGPTSVDVLDFEGPTIIRTYKNRANPYVQIHRGVLEDDRLSWAARVVMAYLLAKPDNWEVRPADLQRNGGCGRDAIRSILKELEQFGYLWRHRVRQSGGTFGWVHRIYESPDLNPRFRSEGATAAPAPAFPSMVEPAPAEPFAAEPATAKASSYHENHALSNQGTIKQDTLTQTAPTASPGPAVVSVGSGFSLEDCRRFAEYLKATGQGIKNPGGYATKIHQTGAVDSQIEKFLNSSPGAGLGSAVECPDCVGLTGFRYVDPSNPDKGMVRCNHEQLACLAS